MRHSRRIAQFDIRTDGALTVESDDGAAHDPDAPLANDASEDCGAPTDGALASHDGASPATQTPVTHPRVVRRVALIFASVLVACTLGYLAIAVPGAWFPGAAPRMLPVTVVRGTAQIIGNQLVVSAPDANGTTLVTAPMGLRASDYNAMAWRVANLANDADVQLLWRSDFQPDKLNSLPVQVRAGRTLPTVTAGNPAWIGQITGVALAIQGPLAHPALIGGVVAKPMGAIETVVDRLREWSAFEPWNEASIDSITGGADHQPIPLPAALALVVGLTALAAFVVRRRHPDALAVAMPAVVAGLFLAGWLALDARWTWNLIRQEQMTATRYGGKDTRDKHLASEDRALFAFIEKARAVLPEARVRIFIAADADYFRGRAAYHLYPNNVYFNPRSNALPPARDFHPGDWLLVYQRRGMQYDRSLGKIRFDGGQTMNAELKLVEPGAALFIIR